jgi:hypothetical protein
MLRLESFEFQISLPFIKEFEIRKGVQFPTAGI